VVFIIATTPLKEKDIFCKTGDYTDRKWRKVSKSYFLVTKLEKI